MGNNKLANRIALLRKENNYTQEEFCDKFNEFSDKHRLLSVRTISAWESNSEKQPSINDLTNLIAFFGVSADYLLGYSDQKNPEQDFSSDTVAKTPETQINFNSLKNYDGEPIYVVFNNLSYASRWGIVDDNNKRIIFKDIQMPYNKNCNYFSFIPPELSVIDNRLKHPYSMKQLLSSKIVWIEILSTEGYLRGLYNGWYKHNQSHTCLINSKGLLLPYEGLGSSFNAYSGE